MTSNNVTSTEDSNFLARAYTLTSPAEASALYNTWSSTYDADLAWQNYASPQHCVDALIAHYPRHLNRLIQIYDAGCGTGLVGACLVKSSVAGTYTLRGADISPGMLAVARENGGYEGGLVIADLTQRLMEEDGSYDVVLCVGTLTKAHVGPSVFEEFVRIVRQGGVVVCTVHGEVWESEGYKAEVQRLEERKLVRVLEEKEFGIVEGVESGGIMIVLRKNT